MKYLLLTLLTTPALADTRISEARASVMALIQPLMTSSATKTKATSGFRVDGCGKFKLQWMDMLLQRESAEMVFTFKPGCDVEGKIRPVFFKPFPVNLTLRNLSHYKRVESENRIVADLQTKPILKLEMRQGILKGSSSVKFEADYRVRIGPAVEKTIADNLGGELRIHEIDGKKVSIKEKILMR